MKSLPSIKNLIHRQKGQSLLELMTSMSLLAIIGTGLITGIAHSNHSYKLAQVKTSLQELANDKIEELSSINPNLISEVSHDTNELDITVANFKKIKFNRSTNVTVNSDRSMHVSVIVSTNHPEFSHSVNINKTLLNW